MTNTTLPDEMLKIDLPGRCIRGKRWKALRYQARVQLDFVGKTLCGREWHGLGYVVAYECRQFRRHSKTNKISVAETSLSNVGLEEPICWVLPGWLGGGNLRKGIESMSTIAINVCGLPLADKLVKGQDIITKSTNNPAVPGNATLLAAFVAAQQD